MEQNLKLLLSEIGKLVNAITNHGTGTQRKEIISSADRPDMPLNCSICGSETEFYGKSGFSLRESVCRSCGATRRQSDLAKIILETFLPGKTVHLIQAAPAFSNLSIYEAQASGPIHDALCQLPGYTCSEFFDGVPPGTRNSSGTVCQDLQNLTFPPEHFHLVITQDVFEHISQPEIAFREIYRVLRPGGFHIFTIPFHEGRPTIRRIILRDGREYQQFPPVFHSDPLRERGSLVYTDFGCDMDILTNQTGFVTEKIPCGTWYSSDEIPYIDGEKEYQVYTRYSKEKNLLEYFLYNSWVFRAGKMPQ